jgi:Tfp pilus assembly protein PilF
MFIARRISTAILALARATRPLSMGGSGWTFSASRVNTLQATSQQFRPRLTMLLLAFVIMIGACNRTQRPNPSSVDRALREFEAKDYRGCRAELDQVIATDAANVLAYGTRAFCRSAMGDINGAIADYSSAIGINPTNPASFNNRGSERMRNKDFDGARGDFETAVRLNPRYTQAWRNLGTVKTLQHDFTGALAEYDRAIEIEPNNAQGYLDRGSTRVEMGDLAAGLKDLNGAVERNSKSAAAYLARARAYREMDNHAAAIRDFTQAIALDPNNPALVYERGCLYYDGRKWDDALADFARTMQLDSKHDEYARIRTALVHLRRGDRESAHSAVHELAQQWKSKPDYWPALIAAFLDGDVERTAFLATAQSMSSGQGKMRECQAYFYAASMRLAEGNVEAARIDFERAINSGQTTLFEYRSAVLELRAFRLGSRGQGAARLR